tara:strand:- start:13406 stop:13534 length:129 start_codon:yes stop_codon:yes gene_type:complete
MNSHWVEIVQSLLKEIKDLEEEVDLLKSILHSNITILGDNDE